MKLCRSYSVHNENLLARKFSSPCSWQTISKFLQKNNMRLIAFIFIYILDNFYSKLQVFLHIVWIQSDKKISEHWEMRHFFWLLYYNLYTPKTALVFSQNMGIKLSLLGIHTFTHKNYTLYQTQIFKQWKHIFVPQF